MICPNCGVDHPAYNFVSARSSEVGVLFFTSATKENAGWCWDCQSPYTCLKCGVQQSAEEFRVAGRICLECKSAPAAPSKAAVKRTKALSKSGSLIPEINAQIETEAIV